MRIEVSNNFSTVDIYKEEQLVSAIDLKGSVFEVAKGVKQIKGEWIMKQRITVYYDKDKNHLDDYTIKRVIIKDEQIYLIK